MLSQGPEAGDDGPRLRGKQRPRGEREGVEAEGDVALKRQGHGGFGKPGESEGKRPKGPTGM